MRYDQNVYLYSYVKYPLFLSVLMKLELYRRIFEKILRYNISWKSV